MRPVHGVTDQGQQNWQAVRHSGQELDVVALDEGHCPGALTSWNPTGGAAGCTACSNGVKLHQLDGRGQEFNASSTGPVR